MKNYWINNKKIFDGPLCVAISCSADQVPGECIKDLKNCRTLTDCLKQAVHMSELLTVIGPADQIALMSTSKSVIFNLNHWQSKKHELNNIVCVWKKVNGVWV